MILTKKQLEYLISKTLSANYQFFVYYLAQLELGNKIEINSYDQFVEKLNEFTKKYQKGA